MRITRDLKRKIKENNAPVEFYHRERLLREEIARESQLRTNALEVTRKLPRETRDSRI